jgi:hypothetical protein
VGEAKWGVSPCQEGTRLIFRIDVDPRPVWLRLLARSMDFKRRHSVAMMKVFKSLRERLDALHARQAEAAGATASASAPEPEAKAKTARAAVSGPTA